MTEGTHKKLTDHVVASYMCDKPLALQHNPEIEKTRAVKFIVLLKCSTTFNNYIQQTTVSSLPTPGATAYMAPATGKSWIQSRFLGGNND